MIPAGIEEQWQEAKRAMGRGDFAAVREACARVLEARPDHARALNFVGVAEIALGLPEPGLSHLQRSVELESGNPALWLNLGAGYLRLEDPDGALLAFRTAARLSPDAPALVGMASCLLNLGRWRDVDDLLDGVPWGNPSLDDLRLHSLAYNPDCTPDAFRAAHWTWGSQFPHRERPPVRDPRPERALRVGFVSPDFRDHSCAYFLEALWEHRDPAAMTLFGYSECPLEDARTRRFQARADGWRPTHGLPDQGVAGLVHADSIDVLIDVAGHTHGNRLSLFALRPAPIQLTWLGYPGTTGLTVLDGRITDAAADPPGADDHATEPLLRLPHFLCYTPAADAPLPGPPPVALGQPPTFGCFNAPAKLNDRVLDLWSRLLNRHPASRLLLKAKSFQLRSAQEPVERAFAACGVAADRIEFVGWLADGRSHLSAYQRLDVALDPFPYNGTTTTCEALWMGVPVVTLPGDRHASRVGRSLLAAAGLTDWVAASEDDFLRIAGDLVLDPAALAVCRRDLRSRLRASALLDGRGFARALEAQIRRLWLQAL